MKAKYGGKKVVLKSVTLGEEGRFYSEISQTLNSKRTLSDYGHIPVSRGNLIKQVFVNNLFVI